LVGRTKKTVDDSKQVHKQRVKKEIQNTAKKVATDKISKEEISDTTNNKEEVKPARNPHNSDATKARLKKLLEDRKNKAEKNGASTKVLENNPLDNNTKK